MINDIHLELPDLNRNQSGDRQEVLVYEEVLSEAQQQRMEALKKHIFAKFDRRRELKESKKQEELNRIKDEEYLRLFDEVPFHEYDYSRKECPICMGDSCINDSLACGHSYCSSCIKLLLKDFIDNGKVFPDELLCPLCEQSIPDSDIQALIGWQYNRLLELREKFKRDKMVSLGQAKYCPLANCTGYVHIINGKLSNACAVCKVTICPNCMKSSHPTLSCEEYASINGSQEDEINELMLSRNWKRCAFCSTLVEKVDGCNFVKCRSNVCKNLDHAICYLCGKGLNEKHHHNHYQKNGPYGHTCNTMDGIEDTPLNEE